MTWLKRLLMFLLCTPAQRYADEIAKPPVSAREARRRWEEQRAREARERAGL